VERVYNAIHRNVKISFPFRTEFRKAQVATSGLKNNAVITFQKYYPV